MIRTPSLVTVLTLLTLTACSNPNTPTTATSPAVPLASNAASLETAMSPAPSAAASPDSKAGVTGLKAHLTATVDALKMDDFAKAKQHYAEFHSGWDGPIEKSVEKQSKANYEEMEKGEKGVKKNLTETANPKKNQAIAAIQTQIKALETYARSLP